MEYRTPWPLSNLGMGQRQPEYRLTQCVMHGRASGGGQVCLDRAGRLMERQCPVPVPILALVRRVRKVQCQEISPCHGAGTLDKVLVEVAIERWDTNEFRQPS